MILRSASYSLNYTENTPITAVRKVCLSGSRHCLSRPIEWGNQWKRATSTNLVSETRTVLTTSFLKTTKLRKWLIEQGNLWEKVAQTHRLGPCLITKTDDYRRILRENWSSRTPSSSSRTRTPNSTRRITASAKRTFVKFINKILLRLRNYENTIMEISGRVQELQNEQIVRTILRFFWTLSRCAVEIHTLPVNLCLSTLSNTRRIVEAFLRLAAQQRRAAKYLGYTWYIGKRFLQIHLHLHELLVLKNCINGIRQSKSRSIHLQWRKVEDQSKTQI